jgi:hypothetical protein
MTFGLVPLLRGGGLSSSFPGRPHGIDLSHPAARGAKLGSSLASVAALPKGNNTGATAQFINLQTRAVLGLFQTGNTALEDSLMGPAVSAAAASGAGYTFTMAASGTPTQFTCGAILRSTGAQITNGFVIGYSNVGDGLAFNSSSDVCMMVGGGPTIVNSGLVLTSGHWYFIGASGRTTFWNFVVKDLITGSVRSAHITTAAVPSANAGAGVLIQSALTQSGGNYVLSVAMVNNAVMLGLTELLTWANDPWAFWVPRREFETLNWLRPGPPPPWSSGYCDDSGDELVRQMNKTVMVPYY